MGVSATDATDSLAGFSNYGQAAFIAAPGTNIQTTDLNGSYSMISGTSASAAIVAGVAGFMKAVDPSLSNGVIVGRMARMTDPAGTQEQTGNGRVNMARALSDTGTDFIEPAGADPVGAGGPFVGPYVAAAISIDTHAPNGVNCQGGLKTTFTLGEIVCAQASGLGSANHVIKWFNPSNVLQKSTNTSGGNFADQLTPGSGGISSATGTWTVKVFDASGTTQEASTTFTLTSGARTTTTAINCAPGSAPVNGSTMCTVTVTDTASGTQSQPSGTVALTSSGTGTFSACTLIGATANSSTCLSSYTPTAIGTGTHNLNANYTANDSHANSSTTTAFALTVTT